MIKNKDDINILILEDMPVNEDQNPSKYKYIDDIEGVLKTIETELTSKVKLPLHKINSQSDFNTFAGKCAGKLNDFIDIAILDYDLGNFNPPRTGWPYMKDILKKNESCEIILVTTDERIKDDISKLPSSLKDMISEMPNIIYISKSHIDFSERICSHIREIIEHIERRRELQFRIVEGAVESYKKFMSKKVAVLIKKVDKTSDETGEKKEKEEEEKREKEVMSKEDTLELDVITENTIEEYFKPLIQSYSILICTEEYGVTNKLTYRVQRPKFYIFSDPLDGSTATEDWIDSESVKLPQKLSSITIPEQLSQLCEVDYDAKLMHFKELSNFSKNKNVLREVDSSVEWRQIIDNIEQRMNKEFKDFIKDQKQIDRWEKKYGPIELNSPMISIVLAERHRVVGNVLINLLTSDMYVSNDSGNYKCKIDNGTYEPKDISELSFRQFSDEDKNSPSKLFICTLQAKNKYEKYINKGKGKHHEFPFLMHFRECLQHLIPHDYDLKKSFGKRRERHDFTPGPGRILFLTDVANKYSNKVGISGGEKELYSCILSSGEPITEWVGWFAFLRHTPHLSAYCLRTGNNNVCQHQIQRDRVKGTMMPHEIASLFKGKMIDFEVLHTGYRDAMQNYTDSIVVFFKDNKSWEKLVDRKLDESMWEQFVEIGYDRLLKNDE